MIIEFNSEFTSVRGEGGLLHGLHGSVGGQEFMLTLKLKDAELKATVYGLPHLPKIDALIVQGLRHAGLNPEDYVSLSNGYNSAVWLKRKVSFLVIGRVCDEAPYHRVVKAASHQAAAFLFEEWLREYEGARDENIEVVIETCVPTSEIKL